MQRIDKFLSHAGIAPRSKIKKMLKEYSVCVNGKKITSTGERIDPEKDEVTLDGEKISSEKPVYFLLNKPAGYISTVSDYLGRENVTDLIDTDKKIYPVGRLDKDTHGLILLTNDGELTHKLIHPKFHIDKTYHLTLAQIPADEQLKALREGVLLKDGITLPATVEIRKEDPVILEVTIHEGRNRQIRRMCETVGLTLLDLARVKFGHIELGELRAGEYRELTEKEIAQLYALTKYASQLK